MDARRGLLGAALTGVVVTAGLATVGAANAAAPTATEVRSVYASDDTYTSSTRTKANFGTADKLKDWFFAHQEELSQVEARCCCSCWLSARVPCHRL